MRRQASGYAWVVLAALCLGCTSPEATRTRAGGPGADVGNRRDQVQAQSLALAGVQWARQILADDVRSGTLDYLGEPWAYPLPPTPIANGWIEGRIE